MFFTISFFFTLLPIFLGKYISNLLPYRFSKYIGSISLTILGSFIALTSFRKSESFDLDNSNSIDYKESLLLGLSLSFDGFFISLSQGLSGFYSIFFPICFSICHILFIFFGTILGKFFYKLKPLPDYVYSLLSGFLLIFIGIIKMFI